VKASLAAALDEVRGRSLSLLSSLDDNALTCQHSPLMSPLVWDLAHVANYEDQWLVRAITHRPADRPGLDDLYDAFQHPRATRSALPVLGPAEARTYADEVRRRALDVLDRTDLDADPLTRDGFVHEMVVQHEHQHDETMLATLQIARLRPSGASARGATSSASAAPLAASAVGEQVLLPGGSFVMGTSSDAWALDNERPAHPVELAPFWLDVTPVTNGAYAAFVADGGYERPRWWTPDGWAWRQEAGLTAPEFWARDGDRWACDRFGGIDPVVDDEPVQHVCWFEADAFARWAGRRLPTEAEWEYAASWTPDGTKRRWPWGDAPPTPERAALWGGGVGPPSVTALPAGANPWGALGLIGGVWEWTSTPFGGHPGFRVWPYKEYSEVFFGTDYRVLRGGSWATHPSCMRATFRNWDFPIRRQIFSGFRCARDAA
jgi:iron(II)-dependent oxidoreductase